MARFPAAFWVLALVLSLFASSLASPFLKDVHDTDVDVYTASTESADRFVVRVERVDAVVDVDEKKPTAAAELIAGRTVDVMLAFDVYENGN
ncbi:hypothetical protein HDV00_000360, partial [Rhizophlyctis rosea]